MNNNLLMLDSFKTYQDYKPGIQNIYAYLENRKARIDYDDYPEPVFFGLQSLIIRQLLGTPVAKHRIDQAKEYGINPEPWQYILEKHGGQLPLVIKAVPEGTVVPKGNVLMTVENTDPNCAWLVNYLEPLFVQLWYPSLVATHSRELKMVLLNALERSGNPLEIDMKVIDFGVRSASCMEAAALASAAHLLSFKTTFSPLGRQFLEYDYAETDYSLLPAATFPLIDHNSMASWGKDNEIQAVNHYLNKYPDGPLAIVCDTNGPEAFVKDTMFKAHKDKILRRNGTFYVAVDYGIPKFSLHDVTLWLENTFGATENSKKFKVLNPKVKVLLLEGFNLKSVKEITDVIFQARWSMDNFVFACGSSLMQELNRNQINTIYKASWVRQNGVEGNVSKVSGRDKAKSTKSGRLKLIHNQKSYQTVNENHLGEDFLGEVFRDGTLMRKTNFDEIRERCFVD